MKLSELLEADTGIPFVIEMLHKLINRGEPVYVLRFLSGGEEAARILELNYTPATPNVGGGLHMKIVVQDENGDPRTRWMDLVHGISREGAAEFDERWTISTVKGRKLLHLRDKKKTIDDLKDEIYFVDLKD